MRFVLLRAALAMQLLAAAAPVGAETLLNTYTRISVEAAYAAESPHAQAMVLAARATADAQLSDSVSITGIAQLRVDAADNLEPGQPAQTSRSSISQRLLLGDDTELELRELYLDVLLEQGTLRIGKQQVVWGQADGLRVLDVINPVSLREFVLPASEDRRIPTWMLNAQAEVQDIGVQLLWIPDATYDEIPLADETFAIRSPRLVAPAPRDIPVRIAHAERPRGVVDASDAGVRLSRMVGNWDVTLNYLHHRHDAPVPFRSVTAEGVLVEPRYMPTDLIGGTFSNAFGKATLRGEVGYSTRRWFATQDRADADGVFKTPEIAWVLGVDYVHNADLLLSMQWFGSQLAHRPNAALRGQREFQVTLLAQQEFANDTVQLKGLVLYGVSDGDSSASASVTWRATDALTLSLGVDAFLGDRDGVFGQFHDASRAMLRAEWSQ